MFLFVCVQNFYFYDSNSNSLCVIWSMWTLWMDNFIRTLTSNFLLSLRDWEYTWNINETTDSILLLFINNTTEMKRMSATHKPTRPGAVSWGGTSVITVTVQVRPQINQRSADLGCKQGQLMFKYFIWRQVSCSTTAVTVSNLNLSSFSKWLLQLKSLSRSK